MAHQENQCDFIVPEYKSNPKNVSHQKHEELDVIPKSYLNIYRYKIAGQH